MLTGRLQAFARPSVRGLAPVHVPDLVEGTLALVERSFESDGVELRRRFAEGLPAALMDRSRISQVILNLLTNAQQSIRSDAQSGTIAVRTRLVDGAAMLEVQDDGPGIPEACRAKIFDPFFTTKPEGHGTGLGLALVHGIVRDHGGTIEALKDAREGACFRVKLPLRC